MSSVVLVTYLYLGHVAVGVAEASIFMPTRRTNAQVSASGAVGPMNVRQVSTPPYLWLFNPVMWRYSYRWDDTGMVTGRCFRSLLGGLTYRLA